MLPEKAGMLPERVVLLRRQPCDGRALRASRRQKLIRKADPKIRGALTFSNITGNSCVR